MKQMPFIYTCFMLFLSEKVYMVNICTVFTKYLFKSILLNLENAITRKYKKSSKIVKINKSFQLKCVKSPLKHRIISLRVLRNILMLSPVVNLTEQ
jgi:hypothetical protein